MNLDIIPCISCKNGTSSFPVIKSLNTQSRQGIIALDGYFFTNRIQIKSKGCKKLSHAQE